MEVADLGWLRSTLLIDDAAKPHVVLDALGDHDVAYLIAHGEVSDNADVLAAASIELAGKARLDGRMLASTAHPVARTMMLNACYSGVMPRGRTDLPGGFWTGLLRGGAMSACITTAAVDPTLHMRSRSGTWPNFGIRRLARVQRCAALSWSCANLEHRPRTGRVTHWSASRNRLRGCGSRGHASRGERHHPVVDGRRRNQRLVLGVTLGVQPRFPVALLG